MTKAKFTVNGKNRKGLLFVSVYGARDFLIYNDKTGVAYLSLACADPSGTNTVQLETARKKDVYAKLNQLLERGYKVYNTFGYKGCEQITNDYEKLEKVFTELSK